MSEMNSSQFEKRTGQNQITYIHCRKLVNSSERNYIWIIFDLTEIVPFLRTESRHFALFVKQE